MKSYLSIVIAVLIFAGCSKEATFSTASGGRAVNTSNNLSKSKMVSAADPVDEQAKSIDTADVSDVSPSPEVSSTPLPSASPTSSSSSTPTPTNQAAVTLPPFNAFCNAVPSGVSKAIATAADLDHLRFELASSQRAPLYHLSQDIVLSGEWVPFSVGGLYLDGRGHKISGLRIHLPASDNVGLFSEVRTSCFKNITFDDAVVVGRSNVGVVAGADITAGGYIFDHIRITNSSVTGVGSNIGGVVGEKHGGSTALRNIIIESSSVSGGSYVGGVVGYIYGGGARVESCTVNASISGTGTNIGGVFGKLSGGSVVAYDLHSSGTVVGPSAGRIGGGFVGADYVFLTVDSSATLNGTTFTDSKVNLLETNNYSGAGYQP